MKGTAVPAARLTASALRADLYKILDRVIQTGQPVLIDRKGVTVKIVPGKKAKPAKQLSRHERLKAIAKPDCWVGDPNDIFHMDYLEEWREEWGIKE